MNSNFIKLRIWCLVGLTLSVYATYVEVKAEQDTKYEAFCDISEKISCTKVFSTRFAKGFGILGLILSDDSKWNPPNGVLGIIFYNLIFFMVNSKSYFVSVLQLLLCAVSNVLSIYLAYLLYFVIENLCVVCLGVYIVNFFCLLESWKTFHQKWLLVKSKTHIDLNKSD